MFIKITTVILPLLLVVNANVLRFEQYGDLMKQFAQDKDADSVLDPIKDAFGGQKSQDLLSGILKQFAQEKDADSVLDPIKGAFGGQKSQDLLSGILKQFAQEKDADSVLDAIKGAFGGQKSQDLLSGILGSIRQGGSESADWPPSFCNGLDCPKFKEAMNTSDYEMRAYDASAWVSTNIAGMDYQSASYTLFMRLFKYISGMNDAKQKIDMTCPVLMRIIPGQGPACESNFTMSFFIATKVADPPKPTDSTVFLNKMPGMKAYVKSFGGFAEIDDYLKEAKALAAALPSSASYIKEYYYTAGYDAPFKFQNRHNEVWFIAN